MTSQTHKVAVALSGGVDSAVAAALLLEQGWQVWGVHLNLTSAGPPGDHLEAVARGLGIPLLELDLQEEFTRGVLDYFVREYFRGRTPNPCVTCNAAIKFGRLWEEVRARGASHLATGHYARLKAGPGGGWTLYRGVDRHKDQSYFLSRLPRELLPNLLFPLGEMTKKEVKARYQELGLPLGADCEESQELCFVPQGRYHAFLHAHRGHPGAPGDLVNTQGRVLGRHRGLEYYTVGQRRGLGVASGEPYYVVALNPETNRVVLGRLGDLLSAGLRACQVNWLIDPPQGELEAQAVIRYRHSGVAARIIPLGPTEVKVTFATPQKAVAPGQAVAFYQNDLLLGGGWIEEGIS
jgi:tRNA-specific 2-thiouridylase